MSARVLFVLTLLATGCEHASTQAQSTPNSRVVRPNASASHASPRASAQAAGGYTTPPEVVDPMAATSAAGSWFSTTCGARTYERKLNLLADGTFTAEDLVSPCPEGAQCVWSGIETRRGKWKQGSKILLLREEPSAAKMGPAFPLELDWDGRLREGSCEYERVPSAK